MKQKQVAVIREAECIGCIKCIQACPVDAILGSRKAVHTVIADECIGCQLCIAPCPVDCIDLVTLPVTTEEVNQQKITRAKQRFQARKKRLTALTMESKTHSLNERKAFIQAALLRTKHK